MKHLFYIPSLALASILLTHYPTQVHAMGILDFMRIYIFSEVDGTVLMDGKPVSGAEVIRTAEFKEKVHTNKVITDDQGRFHFDDLSTFSMRLSETVIYQKIIIKHEGNEYLAWELVKRHENHHGELTDPQKPDIPTKKMKLTCELTNDQSKEKRLEFVLGDRIVYGLSTWE